MLGILGPFTGKILIIRLKKKINVFTILGGGPNTQEIVGPNFVTQIVTMISIQKQLHRLETYSISIGQVVQGFLQLMNFGNTNGTNMELASRMYRLWIILITQSMHLSKVVMRIFLDVVGMEASVTSLSGCL